MWVWEMDLSILRESYFNREENSSDAIAVDTNPSMTIDLSIVKYVDILNQHSFD